MPDLVMVVGQGWVTGTNSEREGGVGAAAVKRAGGVGPSQEGPATATPVIAVPQAVDRFGKRTC
ncbi:hypothetical protein AQJ64_01655 [Streptomyces griseoruber]|uniref:Uncharacterized protein n=1 Tax=Streptomyces griseoruber TaxID=1943 RepID=A0A117RG03_9ACTN|nr:hypothetical protein AQJ64_01655 [Streptomyces griseoruber]